MRGALYEICAIYRRWSERARRCANDVLVKRPLIRLRHLLPQLKSAGGEGLSIGGTAENERHAQLHVAPSFSTNRCRQFHSACEKCGVRTAALATPFIESPSPPTVSCGGRRCRRRMRGALYEICAIYRRWSERARRCANDALVKRPLIRLWHLLPQLKSAGGEGLSMKGVARLSRELKDKGLHPSSFRLHPYSLSVSISWKDFCSLRTPALVSPSKQGHFG